jgi:myo-inositol 2-dehydrogenase/D-chiro-inositol 1-dehydrogenase
VGIKLQVGFNRRFDPSFKKAKDLVAKGTIGTPHLVRITSRDPEPPPISYVKISGGIFLDMGDIDTAIVTLKYEGGAWGTIDNSRKAVYGYDQRIEIFGSEGCVMVGNPTPTEVTINSAEDTKTDKPLYFFTERYQEAYLAEMKEFINL